MKPTIEYEPDQIDMMNEHELRTELRSAVLKLSTLQNAVCAFLDADRDSDAESAAYDLLIDLSRSHE